MTLTIPPPRNSLLQPVVGSVLNAASNGQGAIAPGEIIAIRGMEFSYLGQATTFTLDNSDLVPAYLDGTAVLINGKPAPLLYASPSQINAIVPYEVAGQSAATAQALFNGLSNVWSVPIAPAAPGIFTLDSTGAGQVAVLNQDNSVNGPEQPAARVGDSDIRHRHTRCRCRHRQHHTGCGSWIN